MAKTKEITVPSSLKSLQPVATRHGKEVFLDNPFVEAFTIQVKKKSMTVAAGLEITDTEKNEVKAGAVAVFKEVDTEEFLKIYTNNVRNIFELSSTAQRILMPLMLEIQRSAKNVAHLFFSYADAVNNCKILGVKPMSQATYNRGVNELIERNFIAVNAKGINWYWINPNILFNGDRIRFIQDYKIKRQEERLQEPQQLSLL